MARVARLREETSLGGIATRLRVPWLGSREGRASVDPCCGALPDWRSRDRSRSVARTSTSRRRLRGSQQPRGTRDWLIGIRPSATRFDFRPCRLGRSAGGHRDASGSSEIWSTEAPWFWQPPRFVRSGGRTTAIVWIMRPVGVPGLSVAATFDSASGGVLGSRTRGLRDHLQREAEVAACILLSSPGGF